MNESVEAAGAIKALKEHQEAAKALRDRLDHVRSAAEACRADLIRYQGEMPNLAALEKAESDALAAVALGEADAASAEHASEVLSQGRQRAGELGPMIKTAQSTLAGLERKADEIRLHLAELEERRPAKLKAFLIEEMEAEAVRFVEVATALIDHHARLQALGRLAQDVGLPPHQAGLDMKLIIGRLGWLKAFEGQQGNPHKPALMFEDGIQSLGFGRSALTERKNQERERLADELGIEFAPPHDLAGQVG